MLCAMIRRQYRQFPVRPPRWAPNRVRLVERVNVAHSSPKLKSRLHYILYRVVEPSTREPTKPSFIISYILLYILPKFKKLIMANMELPLWPLKPSTIEQNNQTHTPFTSSEHKSLLIPIQTKAEPHPGLYSILYLACFTLPYLLSNGRSKHFAPPFLRPLNQTAKNTAKNANLLN